MEQQNKQPVQQEQLNPSSIRKYLVHPKLLLAAALVAVVLVVGGILLLQAMQPAQSPVQNEFWDPHEPAIIEKQIQEQVTEFLKLNITSYVQAEPVLGASRFFIYDKVEFYGGNKFVAPFEDGHIGGYLLGEYSIQENGKVQIIYLAETLREENLQDLKQEHGFIKIDISSWQTYRNAEFGFETQIPEEWEPAQNTDNSLLTLDVIPSKPHDNVRFEVSLEFISSNEDFSTWFQRESEFSEVNMKEAFDVANSIYGEGFVNMEDFSVVIEDSQIGGSPTKVQTINCLKDDCYFGGPQNHKEYYIKNEDTIYVFKVWTLNPNKDFSLLDQILSTFRFIE